MIDIKTDLNPDHEKKLLEYIEKYNNDNFDIILNYAKKSNKSSISYSTDELTYMRFFCLAWNGSVRNKKNVPLEDTRQMEAYLRVLTVHAHDFYLEVVEDATNGL